jgi:hypothetical protein
MNRKAYAPEWIAQCPKCLFEVDLESIGWTRIGAYSWGKRHRMHCPKCDQTRWMRVLHVDENGKPDQGLAKVLMMVLLMQVVIAAIVLGILVAVGVVPAPW